MFGLLDGTDPEWDQYQLHRLSFAVLRLRECYSLPGVRSSLHLRESQLRLRQFAWI